MWEWDCHICGRAFFTAVDGTVHHWSEDGKIDHDLDAQHVPYTLATGEE